MPNFNDLVDAKEEIEIKLGNIRRLINDFEIEMRFENRNEIMHTRYETILRVFEDQLNLFEIQVDQFNEEIEDYIAETLE